MPFHNTNKLAPVLQTFILAGYETTSVALTWAIFAIASYPEVERKLLAEVDAFW